MSGQQDPDLFAAAAGRLRDTIKWVVTAFAVIAGLVLGTSPLTGLGSLEIGGRLLLAVLAGFYALLAVNSVVWKTVDLLQTKSFSIKELAEDSKYTRMRNKIESLYAHLLPLYGGSLLNLYARYLAANEGMADPAKRPKAEDDLRKIQPLVGLAVRTASLIDVSQRHERLVYQLKRIIPFAAVCLIVFGWASNPSREVGRDLDVPLVRLVALNSDDRAVLKRKDVDPACLSGVVPIIYLRERAAGLMEGVMLPPPTALTNSDCSVKWVFISTTGHVVHVR